MKLILSIVINYLEKVYSQVLNILQELLWHGRNLIVQKPESLRQEMIGILKDMTMSYETGECQNGEE